MNPRIILGIAIAPLAAPLIYYFGVLTFFPGTVGSTSDFFAGLFVISVFAVPVSYLASVLLGLPSVILLKKYGCLSLRNLILVAIGLGGFIFITFVLATAGTGAYSEVSVSEISWFLFAGGCMAAAVAIVFWYVSDLASLTKK